MSSSTLRKRIHKNRNQKKSKLKDFTFEYGQQDPMDIISYSGLKEQPDYIVIDGGGRQQGTTEIAS